MLTTLALVAALQLTPSQGGKLDLTNIRPTYGVLGSTRPDTKFLPGDTFFLAFDIENIKVSDDGRVQYGMTMEVTDAKGKVWFKEDKEQERLQAVNYLGGTKLPAFANVDIGLNMPAGDYTLKVNVTDRAAKVSKELSQKFEVQAAAFGLVRLTTSYDDAGRLPAPMIGVPGQGMHINFAAVGFERDKSKKNPHITVEMRVLDDAGKPTLPKPFPGEVTDVPEKLHAVPMGFGMVLNRPGKFTVELKATCNISKKTATLKFPLTVLPNDGKSK